MRDDKMELGRLQCIADMLVLYACTNTIYIGSFTHTCTQGIIYIM